MFVPPSSGSQTPLLVAALMLGCTGQASPTPNPATPQATPSSPQATPTTELAACLEEADAADVVLLVDLDNVRFKTGRLIGWNMGAGTLYGVEDDPLHPEWRTTEVVAGYDQLGAIQDGWSAPLFRFSGLQIDGSLGGDGYHFWNYVDPTHLPSADDNVAPFQWMAAIEAAGGDAILMANFGSGTAGEAADYVSHMVGTDAADPLVEARHHWGQTDPYKLAFYELGNEVYGFWNTGFIRNGDHSYANPEAVHGGDPDWHGKPSSDPGDYAGRAVDYVEAMAARDDSAQFLIPVSQSLMEGWGGLDVAIPALRPILDHPRTAAAVVHQYKVDDVLAEGHLDVNSLEMIIAGSEYYRPGFLDLKARLAGLPRPLPIAVTEYHVAGAFAVDFEHTDTAALGLGLADLMIFYADIGVGYANMHMALGFPDEGAPALFEAWYNPFRAKGDGTLVAMPMFDIAKLVADHLLPNTATVSSETNPSRSYSVGDGGFDYPLVQAVAFVDESGENGTVLLLNRDLASAVDTNLSLTEGWWPVSAVTWAPPSPLTNALTTDIPVESLNIKAVQGGAQLTLPPHSVTAITLGRGQCER